jgi:hypothetical protein
MKNSEIKKYIEDGWIRILVTMQVQGNDSKGVDRTLRKQIDDVFKLGKEIEARISKTDLVEESKNWYSQYAEVEILLKDPDTIFDILLDYMISSIEIIAPKELIIKSKTHQDRLNDLALKFRETEKAVLYLVAKNKILERELESTKKK